MTMITASDPNSGYFTHSHQETVVIAPYAVLGQLEIRHTGVRAVNYGAVVDILSVSFDSSSSGVFINKAGGLSQTQVPPPRPPRSESTARLA